MSMLADHAEHDRLRRMAPVELARVTTFEIGITADEEVGRDEVVALLSQRFPFITITELGVDRVFVEGGS